MIAIEARLPISTPSEKAPTITPVTTPRARDATAIINTMRRPTPMGLSQIQSTVDLKTRTVAVMVITATVIKIPMKMTTVADYSAVISPYARASSISSRT